LIPAELILQKRFIDGEDANRENAFLESKRPQVID